MQKIKLTFVLAMILFIAGCKKTNNDIQANISDVIPITSQSAAKQVAYAETNLKRIATEIIKLTKDPAFVSFVESQASKKFGGEYAVLVEKLIQNPVWSNKLNTQNLKEGLASFKNINGRNFYPQIYIPKLLHDEENPTNNFSSQTNNAGEEDSVKVVVYAGDSIPNNSSLNYPGYVIDTDGDLIDWGFINEEYANDHNVWVFSLNEVVDDQGRLILPTCPPGDPDCTDGGGSGGGGGTSGGGGSTNPDTDPMESFRGYHPDMGTNAPVNCKIQNMTVRQHKESWVAGQSEISIRSLLNTINGRLLGNVNSDYGQYLTSNGSSNYLGKLIRQFTRRQINRSTSVNVNYTVQTGWPSSVPSSDPIYFDYVIFEKDIWPTGINHLYREGSSTSSYQIPNGYSQHYRSADGAYDFARITNYTPVLNGNATFYYNNATHGSPDNSITFNVIGF